MKGLTTQCFNCSRSFNYGKVYFIHMEIKIIRETNDFFLGQNKVRWQILMKPTIITAFAFAIFGIILLIIGSNNRIEKSFWNFFSCMGISFLYLSITDFSHTLKAKTKFFSKIKETIARSDKQKNITEISLNDVKIMYKDFEVFYEMKWSVFSSYKFYKNYLFLLSDDTYLTGIMINKSELSVEEFETLSKFIRSRLPEKPSFPF